MKKILGAITTVVGLAIIGFEAGTCVNVLVNTFVQKSKTKKAIPTWRTDEDKAVVKAYTELRARVDDIHRAEASMDIPVSVDVRNIPSSAFGDISAKAGEAFTTLEKNSVGGFVDSKTFADAFKNIPDTNATVNDILGKAKTQTIINNRSEKTKELLKSYDEAYLKYGDLIAKERGYMPKFFETVQMFADEMKKKGVPGFVTYVLMSGPGYFGMVLGMMYLVKVSKLVHGVYRS